MCSGTKFSFDTPAGWKLCRQILKERLPFGPHDYQLEGVTSILDKRDFLGTSATGSGKSAYAYMALLVIQSLQAQPMLCPSVKFPADAAMLMIYPTKALEEDQEKKFQKLGLTAKAINSDTIDSAKRSNTNLWTTVESGVALILVSPEMLSTPGFKSLIESKVFQSRLFAIGVDEVHLLCSWGIDFRPSYHQIAFVRKRFRDDVVMFGMTATLRKGKHFDSVCKFLGFRAGNFKFIRCSNARRDIRLTFRALRTTHASDDFPDLAWVLKESGKTIIFCPSIQLGFRLLVYLWNIQPENSDAPTIRMYNSLNSVEYNHQTFELLESDSGIHIVIATDKLSVGVDISDIRTVVILDPKTLDDLWQKAGRVGRDKSKVKDAQVFIYVPRVMAGCQPSKSGRKNNRKKTDGNKDDGTIDESLHAVLNAPCQVSEIDVQYDNLSTYPPCSSACSTCASRPPLPPPTSCTCSGCIPESQTMSSTRPKAPPRKPLPLSIRVTREMRELAAERLREFRRSCWLNADELTTGMIPIESYLPDPLIEVIIDSLPTFYTLSVLQSLERNGEIDCEAARAIFAPLTAENSYVTERSHELAEILISLHREFDKIRERKREEAKAKRALKADSQMQTQTDGEDEDVDLASEEETAKTQKSGLVLRIDLRKVNISRAQTTIEDQ